MAEEKRDRVKTNPRPKSKAEALLTGPGEKDVTRGGLVFDEVVQEEDIRAIYTRITTGHRDLGKFVGDIFSQWFELEGEDDALVEAILELNERLFLQNRLWETVKHAMLDGVALLYKNFEDIALDPAEEVSGPRELVSLHPIYEPDIDDLFSDKDRESKRFALLDMAKVTITDPQGKAKVWGGKVHWSRLFHVAWDPLYGSLSGTSYFLPSHDSYKALKNIEWAMGETFHRNAAGTKVVDPGPEATDSEIEKLMEAIEDLDAAKEISVPPGTTITTVKPQPIPPIQYSKHFLETVSALPATLLTGAHEGAVTGSETNLRIYHADVRQVQENFISPLLVDFYMQLQEFGLLPSGPLPAIVWNPIWTMTDEQLAMVWERKARSARMLVGNELKGDEQLMTTREIRRMVLGLEPEPAEEDLALAFRAQQRDIDPKDRKHFIGHMTRLTDPVAAKWGKAMLSVIDRVQRAVLARARSLLGPRLDRSLIARVVGRNQIPPAEHRELSIRISGAMSATHHRALREAIQDGFSAALLVGVGSVELKEPVSEVADQDLPADLSAWWESNSFQWSTTMSARLVNGIKRVVLAGLVEGLPMDGIEANLITEFGLQSHQAERIARTESIRAASEGRIREYKRLGVRKLVFMATPDERTDPRCLSLDGTEFTVEASSGVIPVHPNCRCTWVAGRELAP